MKFRTILATAAVFAIAAPVLAASNDATFIQTALKSGTAEIKEGSVQADVSDSYVHDFAGKMVTDHSAANRELLALANELHVQVPSGVAPMAAAPYSPAPLNAQPERAQKMPPAEYFKKEIADHEQAIALFKKEAASGENARVKAFAEKTLPVLESHLALAQKYYKIEKSKAG